MSGEVIFRCENLTKNFHIPSQRLFGKANTLYALRSVNIDVRDGETLGIIGESGCGKSTLGRCMARLYKPTEGKIFYGDTELSALSEKALKPVRRDIQMVFQDPGSSLNPKVTAENAVEEPMVIHGLFGSKNERRDRTLELFREVGLDVQHMQRYPHEFSGGQRQRINIARALAVDPKIMICDEPVSALDVSIQAQVLNLFRDLQQQHGLTYVFISHDLSVIRYVSDRVAVMYLGSIIELCDSRSIYTDPLHPYTVALLTAVPPTSPFEHRELICSEGEIPSPVEKKPGCTLAGRCPNCMPKCRETTPRLTDVGNGHMVACFLHAEK